MLTDGYWQVSYDQYKPRLVDTHIPKDAKIFVDENTGRQFKSSMEYVRKAFAVVNHEVKAQGSAPLNLLYTELEMPELPDGEIRRWRHPVFPVCTYSAANKKVYLAFSEKPEIDEGWSAVKTLKRLHEIYPDGPWSIG